MIICHLISYLSGDCQYVVGATETNLAKKGFVDITANFCYSLLHRFHHLWESGGQTLRL